MPQVDKGKIRVKVALDEKNYRYVRGVLDQIGKKQFTVFADHCLSLMAARLRACDSVDAVQRVMKEFLETKSIEFK